MASSRVSLPHKNVQHNKPLSIERMPKLLKDFLNDTSNSCSSSGFKSFPRHNVPNKPIQTSKTISTFQALINAVKNISFTTVNSPIFLPRSLSRKLSKKESNESKPKKKEVKISVRVKDILRWKSFRDLAEETSRPLDLSPSPDHCTATTTRSFDSFCSTITSTNNSSNFSWCESDFTAEFLPSWSGKSCDEKELEVGEKQLSLDPQEEDISLYDEDDQQSPVSVFDFQFTENEEPFSLFDQSLANMERTKNSLIEKLNEFESLSNLESLNLEKWTTREESFTTDDEEEENFIDYDNKEDEEEKARELLIYVKATSSTKSSKDDQLLLDFFRDELRGQKKNERCSNNNYGMYNGEIVRMAKSWISGDCNNDNTFENGVEIYNREAYVRDMSKVWDWNKFEADKEELAYLGIGDGILGDLVDEFLVDILVN